MTTRRIPIPEAVAAAVLFDADRTCCVCNVRGKPVQLHHIDENPGNNDPANLATLCLDCHNETQVHGGFGRRLNAVQVARYREAWVIRVQGRRNEADRLAATLSTPLPPWPADVEASRAAPIVPPSTGLFEYLATLPELRRLAYEAAEPGWGGSTPEMIEASYAVIEVLEGIQARLARYYPYGHFDSDDPRKYFAELISTRFRWHHYRNSTGGVGHSGTIVGPLTAGDVVSDAEDMVVDLVAALTMYIDDERFSFKDWKSRWEAVSPRA